MELSWLSSLPFRYAKFLVTQDLSLTEKAVRRTVSVVGEPVMGILVDVELPASTIQALGQPNGIPRIAQKGMPTQNLPASHRWQENSDADSAAWQ